MSKWLKILIVLLFIAAIGFGGYKGIQQNKTIKKSNANAVVSFADMNKSKMGSYSLTGDEKVKNILLVGSDKRGSETGYGRSDCMLIVSIDKKNNQLKMTSLLGDAYVDIPGYGENRLSMAYSIGGISLLYETIASNYGIQLNNYAIVEFKDFVAIVDKIGGVTIDVTEFEAKYLQYYYEDQNVKNVAIGENLLNGTQALAYVRIKQDAAGDYGRTVRERKLIKAMYSSLSKSSVSSLLDMVKQLVKSMTTDLTSKEITTYLADVIAMSGDNVKEYVLPADGQYSVETVDGVTVYRFDADVVRKDVADFMYNPVMQQDIVDTNDTEK